MPLDFHSAACRINLMATPMRIVLDSAVYHVTARGNERRDICRNGR